MLRRLRFFGHITRSDSDEDHYTHAVPSMLASMTRRRSGNDLVVAVVKHGYAPSRMTSNIRTWDRGRPGKELMTMISGVISWKQRRSCRGTLHDDDDDDDDLITSTIIIPIIRRAKSHFEDCWPWIEFQLIYLWNLCLRVKKSQRWSMTTMCTYPVAKHVINRTLTGQQSPSQLSLGRRNK